MPESIGIIGLGYVGTAISSGMQDAYNIETYDKFKDSTCDSIPQLCSATKTIFVCVPTPMKSSGQCDISIVNEVVGELARSAQNHLIILKSTVPPKTTEAFNNRYENMSVVFSPEFLTEANYIEDFLLCNRIILGGPPDACSDAEALFRARFNPSSFPKRYVRTDSTTAEMIKYIGNTFLATKVCFANEIKQMCDALDIDYEAAATHAQLDSRLGQSHWQVPGPDGKLGFGGSCFPKDVNALIYLMKEWKINPTILQAVWDKNLSLRPERDWEDLIGRAITKGENNE